MILIIIAMFIQICERKSVSKSVDEEAELSFGLPLLLKKNFHGKKMLFEKLGNFIKG